MVDINDPAAFIAERHFLGGERIVIRNDNELAVEFLRGLDVRGIEARAPQIVGEDLKDRKLYTVEKPGTYPVLEPPAVLNASESRF